MSEPVGEQELGRFFKNAQTQIVFRLSTYRGKPRFDVREYVDTDTFQGFTKAGLNIGLEQLDGFMAALNQAVERARASGQAQSEPRD